MFKLPSLFLALVLPTALSTTLPDIFGREAASTRTLEFDGHTIQVATVPISSSSSLTGLRSKATTRSTSCTSLSKRVTNDACDFGCPVETCTNELSTLPTPPLAADCTALSAAINALAQSELTTTFPCNVINPNCPNFSVPPGFEQQYTLGTCLVGFANLNPTGGPDLSYCNYLVAGFMPSAYSNCIVAENTTGVFCNSQQQGGSYALEIRHV